MELKMLNATLAIANVFNPRKQGKLPAISEQLLMTPAHKLSKMIKDGQLSSSRLCQLVSERIKQVQPHINCMCQDRFDEALQEAAAIDKLLDEFRSGSRQEADFSQEERIKLDSPLLGVPISIKESIQVKGMRNSCGLWERRHETAKEDSVAVSLVRRFGLVPICTSNVPECTLYWADCQNPVYGRSRNPYDLSRITGASSGGEGGLLGSGASLLGIGSDIGGSLRIPAHYCGVYSHKPSPFLLSAEGNYPPIKPARLRLFTLGPMSRYASDLRPLFKCLLQDNEQLNPKIDIYLEHQPKDIGAKRLELLAKLDEPPPDLSSIKVYYFKFNETSQLKGKQSVHVQEELMRGQQEVLEHLVSKFSCPIEELNLDKYLKKTLITWQCLIRCAATKEDRDSAYEDDELKQMIGIDSLLMEFVKMPLGLSKHTKESLLTLIVGSAIPSEREKAFALCERFEKFAQELRDDILQYLNDSSVLIMPTLPTVAHKHNVSLVKTSDIRFPSMFNVLQLPVSHATIRLDETHRLPFGVSIAARPYNDHLTLALAEEIELAFGGWTPPWSKEQLKMASGGTNVASTTAAATATTEPASASTKNAELNHQKISNEQQQQQQQS
uniref:Fatty-acid amide hydrolase 2 n=1 Tax=Aceria tosichella TaxID=561515 RepID=A0A6G1S4Y9_9ACAR